MAKLVMKVIKFKEFEVEGSDKKKTKQTHYTCAYKGRVFGVSTLRFEESDFKVDKGVLTMAIEAEVIKTTGMDDTTGEIKTYLQLVPQLGLSLADF